MIKIIRFIVSIVLLVGLFSCQQDSLIETEENASTNATARSIDDWVIWNIDTEEVGAGKLDSLMTDKATKEGTPRDAVNLISLSGPINSADLNVLKNLEFLDSLSLADTRIIDGEGNETMVFPSFQDIKSQMGILLPSSVTSITNDAFYNGNIRFVNIPDNITNIGTSCFYYCKQLKSARLSSNLQQLPDDVFSYCTALQSIQIPKGISEIGERAFWLCTQLAYVDFSESNVIRIKGAAFSDCSKLGKILLPLTVRFIGNTAFAECAKLELEQGLPENIRTIESYAFRGCSNLKSINLPTGITSFDTGVFAGTGLISVTVPENFPISAGMFKDCTSLTSIDLPEGLSQIPGGFLQGCSKLSEITLPSTIIDIDNYAFRGCGFKEIILPEKLERLGSYVFGNNANLQTLTIPESVTTCYGALIEGCTSLIAVFWNSKCHVPNLTSDVRNTLIYIPDGVTYDENNQNVIVNGKAKLITLRDKSIYYEDKHVMFHCPKSFLAEKIVYTRDFSNTAFGYHNTQTIPGKASRWQSIVLPFSPTSIVAKKEIGDEYGGTGYERQPLAPFDAEFEGSRPFWLRELTATGFADATRIEANKPYIIAMPYNQNYPETYNINCPVEFSAENVTIPVTGELLPSAGPTYSLYPTYSWIDQQNGFLSINENEYTDSNNQTHVPGSIFVSNRMIKAFEAYIKDSNGNTRSIIPIDANASTRTVIRKGSIPSKTDM